MNGNQAQTEVASEAAPAAVQTGAERLRESILLVEDEDFVREVTYEVLVFAGYRVAKARNAAEALRVFHRCGDRVQLLLTDVVLPGRNGRDLARNLRIVQPDLKAIFISGYPDNEITKHGLQDAGMFYLPKPFSVQSLMEKIKLVLGAVAPEEGSIELAKHAAGNG